MKIHTSQCERYGKARVVARYNAETGKLIDYKVYDADKHVELTTYNYNEAHNLLISGNIKRKN